jgi:hypothetical protein
LSGVWGDCEAANGKRAASQLIGSKVSLLQLCLSIEESLADLTSYSLATDDNMGFAMWGVHHTGFDRSESQLLGD